jgi:hypothetical protein
MRRAACCGRIAASRRDMLHRGIGMAGSVMPGAGSAMPGHA